MLHWTVCQNRSIKTIWKLYYKGLIPFDSRCVITGFCFYPCNILNVENREQWNTKTHQWQWTPIYALENSFGIKPYRNVRLLCSILSGMEMMQRQRRRHCLWSYTWEVWPVGCNKMQTPLFWSLYIHTQLLCTTT